MLNLHSVTVEKPKLIRKTDATVISCGNPGNKCEMLSAQLENCNKAVTLHHITTSDPIPESKMID